MGILGLDHLLHLTENHPQLAHNILTTATEKSTEFPMAITGISITKLCLTLAESGKLNYSLYRHRLKLEEVYCQVFGLFASYYATQKPENLMSFGPIYERFCCRLNVALYARLL